MKKYLRITQVIEKIGVGKSTIWLWSKEGKFPKPIKISTKVTVWEEEKIDEWIQLKNTNS
mgnify:CR=1 FL=1